MHITENMDLPALCERMGPTATLEQAGAMRSRLVQLHDQQDTAEVPGAVWHDLVEAIQKALPPPCPVKKMGEYNMQRCCDRAGHKGDHCFVVDGS